MNDTDSEMWAGGYYQLSMDFDHTQPQLVVAAEAIVWTHPALSEDRDASERLILTLDHFANRPIGRYGSLGLQNRCRLACKTTVILDCEGVDTINLNIAFGAISDLFPGVGGFPINEFPNSRPWREPIDDVLRTIGIWVNERVPFLGAAIGHEVSGETDFRKLDLRTLPKERWPGLLVRADGKLLWFPSTIW